MEPDNTVIDLTDPCLTNSSIGHFPLCGIKMEQTLIVDANMIIKVEPADSADPVNAPCSEKQMAQNDTSVNQGLLIQGVSKDPGFSTPHDKHMLQTLSDTNVNQGLVKHVISKDPCSSTLDKQTVITLSDTSVTQELVRQGNTKDPGASTPLNKRTVLTLSDTSVNRGLVKQGISKDPGVSMPHDKQIVKTMSDTNMDNRVNTRVKRGNSKNLRKLKSCEKKSKQTSADTKVDRNTKLKRGVSKDSENSTKKEKAMVETSNTGDNLNEKDEQNLLTDPDNTQPQSDSEFNSDTTDVESLDELYVTFKEKPGDNANQSKNDSDEDYYPSDQGDVYGCDENMYRGKRRKIAKNDFIAGKMSVRTSRRKRQRKNVGRKTEEKPKVIKVSKTKYKCSICSEIFSTSDEVTEHIPNHLNIQCEDCSETFRSYNKMLSHKKKMHKRYKCSFADCQYEADKQALVRRHINLDHKSYSCSYCTFTAPRKSDIQAHSQVKHKGQPPQLFKVQLCHVCGAEFNSSHTYHQHVLRQHGIQMKKSHVKVCSICSEELMDSYSLRHHIYMMHTEKHVKCKFPSCNSCFKIKAQMESHYRVVHLGSLNLNCPYEGCSYSSRRHHIQKHINMVHLKIRNHPCSWPECGKIFYDKHHLAVHMLMHTGAKPLGCDICDYRCRQRAALKWHMKKKHPECQEMVDKKPSTASIEWPEQNPPVGIPAVSRAHKPGRKGRR